MTRTSKTWNERNGCSNGSKSICRVGSVLRSLSPDPRLMVKRMKALLAIFTIFQCGCSSYVYRAYFTAGQDTSIRGYPTVDPPDGYTGIWTHYKWNGQILAQESYLNGKSNGTSYWYKDNGKPYLIRLSEGGEFVKDYYIEPLPKTRPSIPFWFPARYRNGAVKACIEEGYPHE